VRWRTIAAVTGGYAAVLAVLFWRVWVDGQRSGWDCLVEYWPDQVFQLHALRDGELPLWNPYALGGYPFWADPQAGLLAPVTWLTWLAAGIGGDGAWLIQLKVFVNLLVGLGGMHAFAWHRTRSHAAGFIAAITLVAGAPLLVHKSGALIWPMLYLPWALLALARFVERPSARRAALLGGAVWLVGSAGHPQGFFYAAVVLVLYAAFLTITARELAPRRWLVGGAIAAALSVLLLAATWVPASRAVDDSPRAVRGEAYVLEVPLETDQTDELLVPEQDDNWQADVYVGPLALIGGLWLVSVGARGRRRAEAGVWLGIAALGVLLAMGRDGYLLPWFADHVPGFDLFRIAYRHKLIFGVAAAVLAGDTAAALLRGDASRTARWIWLGLGIAWLELGLGIEARWPTWPLAAALVTVGAAAVWARPWRRALTVALPAIVFLDLWDAGATKLEILQDAPPDAAAHAGTVAALDGTDLTWRYHVGDAYPPYGGTVPFEVAVLYERREQSGYANPIEPVRHAVLEARALGAPELLAHFNVKYFAGWLYPPWEGEPVAPGIVALADVAPLARWYGRAEVVDAETILTRLSMTKPSERRAALVELEDVRGVAFPSGDEQEPVAASVVQFGRNELALELDAPAAGVLVIAEAYAPGWEATVNGAAARVFRADFHQRAVIVPAGRSRVVLRFAPDGLVPLAVAFVAGLIALAVLALGRWRWLDEPRLEAGA